jgi:hypothetical protein
MVDLKWISVFIFLIIDNACEESNHFVVTLSLTEHRIINKLEKRYCEIISFIMFFHLPQ